MTDQSNLPVRVAPQSALMDVDTFTHMNRVAKVLAMSPLFPEHLRKGTADTAIANGILCLNMAMRQNEDVLTVAQNIYFVGGKPGWASTYMIAKANQHGVFKDPIDWEVTGSKAKGDLSVTAFAHLSGTGKKVKVNCDMELAKAEGWTKNAKYQSMPEQMLRYRSATFLIRLYCPEVMVGVPSIVELETSQYKDITPDDMNFTPAESIKDEPEIEDAKEAPEDEESEPKKEAAKKAELKKAEPKAQDEKADAKAEDNDGRDEQSVHDGVRTEILEGLLDGASVAGTRKFYEDELKAMKDEEPDLFAQLDKELDEAEKAEDDAAEGGEA